MWKLIKRSHKTDTKNRLLITKGKGWGVDEMKEAKKYELTAIKEVTRM